MIVRILDGVVYEVARDLEREVLALDVELDAAVVSKDEERFVRARAALIDRVRGAGVLVATGNSQIADIVVPSEDLSLQTYRRLLDSEAYEC